MNQIGIDLPQAYLGTHLPNVLAPGGIDIRVGKFYTLMGRDVYPAADTDFYSRSYENIYATPFTHTGALIPWRAVIIRPELRVDWSPDARPYDDQTKKVQFVPAIDLIVRF